MKNIALGVCAAIGLVTMTLPSYAQYYDDPSKADRRFYLSPMATYSVFDGDRHFDDSLGYQFSIGKILAQGSNLEIHGTFAEPDADAGGSAELLSYGLSVLLFQSRKEFPLYAILSVSKGNAEASGAQGKATSDQFDAGIGYQFSLGEWPLFGSGPALRIEARYRTDKYSQGQASTYNNLFGTSGGRTYHDGVFGVGLFLPLGADPAATPKADEPKEPDTRIVISPPDTDGDQIPDDMDDCPNTPKGAVINVRGCEHDSDKDGVPNSADACPGTPVGANVDAKGCQLDSDADGVIDDIDQCRNTPQGASVMADGCALRNDCRIPAPGQRIDASGCATGAVVLQGVTFETASADLTAPAKRALDDVARAIGATDQIRLEVAGHTDNVGDANYNLRLSQLRANAVRNHLLNQGVDGKVLIAKGYGATRPLASNDSPVGRKNNRRVELVVIDE